MERRVGVATIIASTDVVPVRVRVSVRTGVYPLLLSAGRATRRAHRARAYHDIHARARALRARLRV